MSSAESLEITVAMVKFSNVSVVVWIKSVSSYGGGVNTQVK